MPEQNDLFDHNMALLEEYHPRLWIKFNETPPEPLGEVFPSKSGAPNLKLTGEDGRPVIMHHPEDPAGIGDRFLDTVPEGATGFVTIIGMGLGHGAMAVIKNRPEIRHLVIFELDPGVFAQALRHLDLEDLLKSPKVILSVNPEPDIDQVLAPAARAMALEDIHILRHLPSFTFNPEYDRLNAKLFQRLSKANVEGNTNIYHGRSYMTNRLKNLKTIHHHYLIDRLFNRFHGIPAIIVAGGPSLDKNIDQLKEARDRAVIIAVDSTLPTLLAHGVTPTFITSIDPQDLIFEKFAGWAADCREASLITMPWVSSKVVNLLPTKKTFFAFTASVIEQYAAGLVGSVIRTGGAATVAHLNLQAASLLGCSPIIFVGQDLAYSDNKDHAANTALTHKESMDMAMSSKTNLIWADGVNGEKVATNRPFFEMKCHFEKMIDEIKDKFEFINSTEGGVHIEGTRVLPLRESIKEYCREKRDIGDLLHPPESVGWHPDPKKMLSEYKKLLERINTLQKTIKKNSHLTGKVLNELKKTDKSASGPLTPQDLPADLQKKITRIDTCHRELDQEKDIWRLIQELTLKGIKQSEQEKQQIRELEGRPDKYSQWLKATIECLEGINQVRSEALALIANGLEETIEFHHQEAPLIRQLAEEPDNREAKIKLARLYHKNDNIVLLNNLIEDGPESSAEILFYKGLVRAYWSQFDSAEEYFRAAISQAKGFAKKIRAFREKMAEEYRKYGRNWIIDVKSRRRLLLKGFQYCDDYPPLIDDIRKLAKEDLGVIRDPSLASPNLDHKALIRDWCRDLDQNDCLRKYLPPEEISAFFKHLLPLQREEQDIAGLLESYSRIIAMTPDNAAIHHQVADLLFSIGEFAQGIKHLEEAIRIEPGYAIYWEKIGDELMKSGQQEEALIAYEKSLAHRPDHYDLLKKIGDCHMALDQPEAAREAYLACREKMLAAAPDQALSTKGPEPEKR